jgi:ATP-dependent helicase/nuclease subunit A
MTTSKPADHKAREAVRRRHDQTLFVEAGAGTGKTTELVMRVLELVAHGQLASMASLAAITFTENAAAELRTRIREALEDGAEGQHRDRKFTGAERALLATALEEIDDAAVTTLHGFSTRILQDAPLEAGLPPGFAVNDAIRSQLEAAARWRSFMDDLLDDPSLADHVLAALTLELNTDKLRVVAHAFAGSWDLLQHGPFSPVPLPPVELDAVLKPLRQASAYLDDAPAGDGMTKHLEMVVVPFIDELEGLDDRMDLIEALHRTKMKSSAGQASAWKGRKPEIVALLLEAQEAAEELLSDIGAAATETLCARMQDFVLAEAGRRQRAGSLTFHDLLVLTRDVLRKDRGVRDRLHARYPVLLIDEFQDTDPLQVEIACLIAGDPVDVPAEDWADMGVGGGRLFFVGDAKQSIYRFRRADVQLYRAVGKKFSGGTTTLSVNFRSVPAVVSTVNTVFQSLIGGTGEAYGELHAHRQDHAADVAVRLLGGPSDGNADAQREAEAAHLADLAVRAKVQQWQVSGRKGLQAASYRDIAILLPTRTSLPAIEAALQARDVPYRVESRSLVWATDAVRDVVTLLQALAAPADQVAVVTSLRHPGLACSDVDLAEWAAAGGRWSYLAPPPEGMADSRVAGAMRTLRDYHDLRWWLPVNELVERIVRELRLVELTAELRRPRDHWRRLRFVVDQARAFCDAGGHGLGEFVQWASDQIESEADALETVVPESDDDAVRILTVHGAKGLQFPITVVAGLGIAPRTETTLVWADRPEVRLKAPWLKTSGFDDAQAREKAAAEAEAVRLLYVAMTRAQDFLVLGCYHKPTSTAGSYGSHAQQLWTLLGDGSSVLLEPAPTGTDLVSPAAGATCWPEEMRSRQGVAAAHELLLAEVQARVATTPTALVAASAAPATEDEPQLDRAEESSDAEPAAPARRRMPSRTGAAIGTAVHAVLELADLQALDADEFRRLAEMLAETEEIPALATDVAARALGAAQTLLVRQAVESGRYWREVYLVVDDKARVLEGYVDLLVEVDGQLIVVDYKTDRALTSAELDAKAAHYGPQLSAYGAALQVVLNLAIRQGTLLFAGAAEARHRNVELQVPT